jgi:pimeloyl-ACP methyl ester carboxylesterase
MIALVPGGVSIAYDESGSGVPLLLIHGWPHNRRLWSGQLSGLPTQARCIAPDLRGFGESSVMGPHSIDQYADDLVALLDALGIDRVVGCGLSMGGYVAFSLFRRHRARLRGLILTSTRASADTPEAREKRARLIELVRSHGVEALADKQLRAMVGRTTFESREDVREALRTLMASAPADGVVGALQAMAERRDSTDLLATIDLPTLVIGGAEDGFTPPEELEAMAKAIPDCRFELIAGAGHACAFERPAAYNHLVSEYLNTLLYD